MKFFKYIFFLLLCPIIKAGNNPAVTFAKADFKKVNEAYAKAAGLSMDTYYTVFSDHYSQNMIEGKRGSYIKYTKNLYTSIDGIETYSIDDKIICINKEDKQITIGDYVLPHLSPLQTNTDTLLTLCDNIQMEQINATERKYKLYFKETGSEFCRIDVLMDLKELRYVKLTLYYSVKMNLKQDFYAEEKAPRLEISYRNLKFINTTPAIFNQSLYVLNIDGKLKPAPKYYNFKVSDLRNQTRIKTKPKSK